MSLEVGQIVTLKANAVLGSVAEYVEVLEIDGDTVLVGQLTHLNGEPGEFYVSVYDLVI